MMVTTGKVENAHPNAGSRCRSDRSGGWLRPGGARALAPLFLAPLCALLLPSLANAAIVHEATFTADSATLPATILTVNNVTAGTDQLYLVSIAYYKNNQSVSSVSGGGLTWTLQRAQHTRRLSLPCTEVWQK